MPATSLLLEEMLYGVARVNGNGTIAVSNGSTMTVNRAAVGRYDVTLDASEFPTVSPPVSLTLAANGGRDDYLITYEYTSLNVFRVVVTEQDNGGAAGAFRDSEFSVVVFNV